MLDEATASAPPVVAKSRSLGEILEAITNFESAMESDVDPNLLFGEMRANDLQLRDKVDAIVRFTEEREAYAERLRDKAESLLKRATSAENGAERLRSYVLVQMQGMKFDRLPGNEYALVRRKASTGRLTVTRTPTPEDMLNEVIRPFVKRHPAVYSWDSVALKKAIVAQELGMHDFARIEEPTERVEFEDADKPKTKKKTKQGG